MQPRRHGAETVEEAWCGFHDRGGSFYRCLSGDPAILAGTFDNPHSNFFNPEIVASLADRGAFMIVYQSTTLERPELQSTTLERPERATQVIEILRERMAAHPRHRYFAMCNTAAEVEICARPASPAA